MAKILYIEDTENNRILVERKLRRDREPRVRYRGAQHEIGRAHV